MIKRTKRRKSELRYYKLYYTGGDAQAPREVHRLKLIVPAYNYRHAVIKGNREIRRMNDETVEGGGELFYELLKVPEKENK